MRYTSVRPLAPSASGVVERDGVGLYWERYGEGEPAILLLPPWNLSDSRVWKMQIPHLARRTSVIVFDAPGSGRSGPAHDHRRHAEPEAALDALAVLDAAGFERAIFASFSRPALRLLLLATEHADHVAGAIFVSPLFPLTQRAVSLPVFAWAFAAIPWIPARILPRSPRSRIGRLRFNRSYWRRNLDEFLDWFMGEVVVTAPHSSRLLEEVNSWAREADPESLGASLGRGSLGRATKWTLRARARKAACPTLVIHSETDLACPLADGRVLAELSGGELCVVPDGGHAVPARKPVEVNLAIERFADAVAGAPAPRSPSPSSNGKRVLWWSSPLGLGHAQRDLAIVRALRALRPDVSVDWLAEAPVRGLVEREGEHIHPASDGLPSECSAFESQTREHHLHAMEAWRACNEVALAEFTALRAVMADEHYDLLVGDEAWGIDYYLHENPREKRAPYVWLADFVGFAPVPEDTEETLAHGHEFNAQMIEHVERVGVRDLSLFVGNPDDVVEMSLGPGLPEQRDWVGRHFEFAGYVSDYDPAALDRDELRAELGWQADETVCLISVGGSGAGEALLRRGADAVASLRDAVPGIRVVAVTGPRIDPAAIPPRDGLEVLPYVHNLYRMLAACDVALTQGGLTTCMELAAARRPFVYVPLVEHFEQQVHVDHRLRRYRAGRRLDYVDATPEAISAALVAELGREQDVRPVETGGALAVAERLAPLL